MTYLITVVDHNGDAHVRMLAGDSSEASVAAALLERKYDAPQRSTIIDHSLSPVTLDSIFGEYDDFVRESDA